MQNSNTALETATIVRYDPNTCFYMVPLILMHRDLQISKMSIMYQKYYKNYCYNAETVLPLLFSIGIQIMFINTILI